MPNTNTEHGQPTADAPQAAAEAIETAQSTTSELAAIWRQFRARVSSGDIGALPIVVGLIIIGVIFQSLNSVFLSPRNLSNLATNLVPIGVMAVGVALTLLVAQIDLSIGSMAGASSALFGVLLVRVGWPMGLAMLGALVAGVIIGIIYSYAFTRFSVPSFVSTLAGLLSLLGVQLALLENTGSINVPFDSALVGFMQRADIPPAWSYVLAAVAAAGFFASRMSRRRRRQKHHLHTTGIVPAAIATGALLVVLEFACWYLNKAGGVSLPFVSLVVLVIVMSILLKRTRWGRSIYAIGGSVEAARRAGIKLNRVYLSVFIICAVLAAVAGLLFVGQLAAASTGTGTERVNLNAIAAAVIGGTSLFGGRGGAFAALLGVVVIEAINNGLVLLNLSSAVQFIITGGVLMVAVIVDSLAQKRRTARGVG